jgi:hypothetical protein
MELESGEGLIPCRVRSPEGSFKEELGKWAQWRKATKGRA